MKKKILLALSLLCVCAFSAGAIDPKLEGVISKLRENQSKIQDMSASIVTVLKSDTKEKKSMEQRGTLMIKGDNMSKMEMTAPVAQITVTNKDKMAIINPSTGKSMVQDLKKMRKDSGKDDIGKNPLDQTRILDMFDLSMEERGIISKSYVITGVPKDKNKFMCKIKFYVDAGRNVPTKVEVYNAQDKVISSSDLEYTKIKDIWVMSKNTSWISIPGGKMDVSMKFENIKINEGISDSAFAIK